MTNYYEELGLEQEMSTEEINNKLYQLENVWNQRLMNEPEKANGYLKLINEAREIFATIEKKAAYDSQIQSHGTNQDHDRLTNEDNFNKWYNSSKQFFDNEDYELSMSAIEKAIGYYDANSDGVDFLGFASDVYRMNNFVDKAVEYANQAIIIAPDQIENYARKGLAKEVANKADEAIEIYKKALVYASANNDEKGQAMLQSLLARIYYLNGDYENAEISANEAIKFGDFNGIGNDILSKLDQPIECNISALESYKNEKCHMIEEIEKIAYQISATCNMGSNEKTYAWVLKKVENQYINDDDPKTMQSLFGLSTEGKFQWFHSEYSNLNEPYRLVKTYDLKNMDRSVNEFLEVFDFCGEYDEQSYVEQRGMMVRKRGNDIRYIYENDKNYALKRMYRKGYGLYMRLLEILDNQEAPQIIESPQYREQVAIYEKQAEQEQQRREWINQGKCKYCGGNLTGLFSKKCVICGKKQ